VRFGFLHDFPGLRGAVRRTLALEHEVVWAHSANWAYFLPEAELGRTVLDVQDCYDLGYRRRAARPTCGTWEKVKIRAKRHLYRRFVRRHMQAVRRIVMVNREDARSLSRILGGRRVEVVTNGVDARYFAPSAARPAGSGAPTLLFTGAMGTGHNVDAALFFARQVLPRVRRRVPECRFVVVGKSPSARVKTLERTAPGTRVVGAVEDVRPSLWSADVYVAPMVSGTGVKNKILEAWAAGCPVVSTSLGCEALRSRHGKNVLIADEPAEMARQVLRLLQDPPLRHRLGEAGRETARRFYRWDVQAGRFEKLLLEAAQARRVQKEAG
jgi:glycosyltransferase involved in cell wall biosynthesis